MLASDSTAPTETFKTQSEQIKPKLRIVFMGSPEFAIPCLDHLYKTHDVRAVYSQPAKRSGRGMKITPVPVAKYAKKLGLPLFTPHNLKSDKIEAQLFSHQADIFVVVAYGLLLPDSILAIPRLGCLNGHASLLPRWRGAAPIQRAIEAGDKETGISIMLMDNGLDTGPIVSVNRVKITKTDTAGSMHDRLARINASCLGAVIDSAPSSLASPTPQSKEEAIYADKITSKDTMIDWANSNTVIDCHIRAFSPHPGAWCKGPKGRLRILKARPIKLPKREYDTMPGRFLGCLDDGAMVICCGFNALAIEKVQPAGKMTMAANDFLNGSGMVAGDTLDPLAKKDFT